MYLADMTGVQLAQTMRADERLAGTGFVLITAPADAQEADLLRQAGNVVRLGKPFDLDGLRQALTAATANEPLGTAPGGADRLAHLRVLVAEDSAAARRTSAAC